MVSTQVLKSSIEELYGITKVSLAIYDDDASMIAKAGEPTDMATDIIESFMASPADSQVVLNTHLFKVFDDDEPIYVIAASGNNDSVYMVGKIAVAQIKTLIPAYKEKYDRNNFFQNLLMDNMLLVDVYNNAKKLHIDVDTKRIVLVVENKNNDNTVTELLKNMFNSHSGDFVTCIDESNVIVIKSLSENDNPASVAQIAQSIVDNVNSEAMVNVRVGYGSVVSEIKDVSKSYKEAMMAVEVGKIFYAERKVNSYSSLGIGRLIYQLPPNLCQIFIEEIFKDNDPSSFDEEIVTTVYKFFENSLNVSETSRQLFIHRNTLVYRVEKLKALTGLDVRVFDDALTFMIAMMVYNYLRYLDSEK